VLAIPLPGIGLLVILLIATSVVLAIRWRSALPLTLLLLNPASISFGLGLREWFSEKPRLSYMGLPDSEFFNLDPTTRCYRSTGGCMVSGNEWLTQSPHNAALGAMVDLFGPPKGTYHGPYPSESESVGLTDSVAETPPELFLKGSVLANGKEIALGQKNVKGLLQDFQIVPSTTDLNDSSQTVKAAVFRNSCLVVRIGFKEPKPADSLSIGPEGIVLLDLDSLRPFALYVLSGHISRIPRLLVD